MIKKMLLFGLPFVVPMVSLVSSCKTEQTNANNPEIENPSDDSIQKPNNPDVSSPDIPENTPNTPEIPGTTPNNPEESKLQIVNIEYDGDFGNAELAFKAYFYGLGGNSSDPGGSEFRNRIVDYLKEHSPKYSNYKNFIVSLQNDKNDSDILNLMYLQFYIDTPESDGYIIDSQTIETQLHYKFIFTKKSS